MYTKKSGGIKPVGGQLEEYAENELMGTAVFTDNNEVYFLDIISTCIVNSYVKGTVDGSTISLPVPQCLISDRSYGYGFNLVALKPENDQPFCDYILDPDVKALTFTIDPEGNITLDKGMVAGIVDDRDNSWGGWADTYQSYTPYAGELVRKPASLPVERWMVTTLEGYPSFADVALTDNEIYIGNISQSIADGWFKGDIQGDKVTINDKQLMGTYKNKVFVSLMFGDVETTTSSDGVFTWEWSTLSNEHSLTYTLDRNLRRLTPDAGNLWMFINGSVTENYVIDKFHLPTFEWVELKGVTPPAPSITAQEPFDPAEGFGSVSFDMPVFTEQGDAIDTGCYFYKVYLNGEEFDFYPDQYLGLTSMLSEVPFSFNDPQYMDFQVKGTGHKVFYYAEGADTFGLQSVYRFGDTTYSSAIVTLDLANGSVTVGETPAPVVGIDLPDAEKTVERVIYYDLNGRELHAPAAGIAVERTVYSDGSFKSKLIRR